MYERMLDKQKQPDFKEMMSYCNTAKECLRVLDLYFKEEKEAEALIRFPYGKNYGWGIKYAKKKKHICDVFAEKDAVMVLIRLDHTSLENVYKKLDAYGKSVCDEKYPCGDGGWLNYRITKMEQLPEIERIVDEKCAGLFK